MSVNINASTTNGLVLTSDTSGELKLQANGADIATVDSSGITMASGKTIAGITTGKILQVVSTTKANTTSVTGNNTAWADISGMSVAITPTSTSSKILVFFSVNISQSSVNGRAYVRLLRDTTAIDISSTVSGTAPQNLERTSVGMRLTTNTQDIREMSSMYLDSPSTTSATTYKLQWKQNYNIGGSTTLHLNSQAAPNGTNDDFDTTSHITVMEVAG